MPCVRVHPGARVCVHARMEAQCQPQALFLRYCLSTHCIFPEVSHRDQGLKTGFLCKFWRFLYHLEPSPQPYRTVLSAQTKSPRAGNRGETALDYERLGISWCIMTEKVSTVGETSQVPGDFLKLVAHDCGLSGRFYSVLLRRVQE